MARSKAAGRAKKQQANVKKAIICSVCGKEDGKYKCPKCRAPFCCVQCSKDHKANHCPATKINNNSIDDNDVSNQQLTNSSAAVAAAAATAELQSKYLPAAALKQAESASSQPKKKRVRRNEDEDSDDDQPGFNITEEMKQMIQRSEWLRKELEDGGLRQLIEQIDAASDVEEEDDDDNNNDNKRRKNWGRNGQQKHKKNGNADISPRVLALARTKHSHPKFATFIDRLLLTAGVLTDGGGQNGGADNLFDGQESGRLELVPVPRRGGELVAAATAHGKAESGEEDSSSEGESDESSHSGG